MFGNLIVAAYAVGVITLTGYVMWQQYSFLF